MSNTSFTDRARSTSADDDALQTKGNAFDVAAEEQPVVERPVVEQQVVAGPTVEVAAESVATKPEPKDLEDAEEHQAPLELGEDHVVNYVEVNPVLTDVTEDDVDKMRIYTKPFESFNTDAIGWTASLIDTGNKWDEERPAELLSLMSPKSIFSERFAYGDYTNQLMHEDRKIGPQRPKIGTGGELTGDAAIELIKRKSTGGGSITYPLPHSGFWLTVSPPIENELVDVDHEILMSATQVGNSTFGLLLNSRSGVFSRILINFALSKVTASSLKLPEGLNVDSLLDYISPLDYPIIINYLLGSMFMKGYPWDFTCSSSECQSKRSTLINLVRAVWFDNSAISPEQRELLIKGRNSCRPDDVTKYRDMFTDAKNNSVTLGDITIHFKVGSMGDFLTASDRWVQRIEAAYTSVLKDYTSESKRKTYINGQIQASRMNRYRHMVDYIEIDDSVIRDYETITSALDNISSINEDWNLFESAVVQFIEQSTVAIVGIPTHKCTVCDFEPTEQKGRFKSIMPIAPDRCFFTLIQQQAVMMASLAEG